MTKQPDYLNSKGKKRYAVLARNRDNDKVSRVWTRQKVDKATGEKVRKFKRSKDNPNKDADPSWSSRMTSSASKEAKKWAEAKGFACYRSCEMWPFLLIYNTIGDHSVGKRLNRTARDLQRYMKCGWERDQAQQHDLYQGYRKGYAGYNLAACCDQTCSIHDKKKCGNGPCKSNHCGQKGPGSGVASDTSVFRSGRDGSYVAIRAWTAGIGGKKALANNNLKALVSSEDWHVSPSGY